MTRSDEGRLHTDHASSEQFLFRGECKPDLLMARDWERPLAEVNWTQTSSVLSYQIEAIAGELRAAGDEDVSAILSFLAHIAGMSLQVGGSTLFRPWYFSATGSSASIDHLSKCEASMVETVARTTSIPWLSARTADVALESGAISGKAIQELGLIGSKSYLVLAEGALDATIQPESVDYIRRALALGWRSMKADVALQEKLWSTFMEMLERVLSSDSPALASRFTEELLSRRSDKRETAAELIERAAQDQTTADGIHSDVAEALYRQAARIWNSLNRQERARSAGLKVADVLLARARATSSAMLRSTWLAEAVATMRRNRGDRDEIRRLQNELEEARRLIEDEMVELSHTVDLSHIQDWVDQELAGDDYPTLLIKLSFAFAGYPNLEEERESVLRLKREFVFSSLMGTVHMDGDGVPVRHQPPFDPENPELVESAVIEHICETRYALVLGVFIDAAVSKLSERFCTYFSDILAMVRMSSSVPRGHEWQIARGLDAGLNHRWADAAVFLIPCVEAFVRADFKRLGVNTLVVREDGSEEERSLNELLALDDTTKALPAGLSLELKSLMTHKAGCNLRNRYAHGLLSDEELSGYPTLVMWWTVMRLTLRSFVSPRRRE